MTIKKRRDRFNMPKSRPGVDIAKSDTDIEWRLLVKMRIFERRLRLFIKTIIIEKIGPKWWNQSDPKAWPLKDDDIKELMSISERVRATFNKTETMMKRMKEVYSSDLYNYLEFSQYKPLIISLWETKTGKPWFLEHFPDKSYVDTNLDYLNYQRNAILGHDRAELDDHIIKKIELYIDDFTRHFPKAICDQIPERLFSKNVLEDKTNIVEEDEGWEDELNFESIIRSILEQTGMSREIIMNRIDILRTSYCNQISPIGLALIISEKLGLAIVHSSPIKGLSEILEGIKKDRVELGKYSFKAHVQQILAPRSFTKKDGSEGKVVRIIVGDFSVTSYIVFWTDQMNEFEKLIIGQEYEFIELSGKYNQFSNPKTLEFHVTLASKIEHHKKEVLVQEVIDGLAMDEQTIAKAISIRKERELYCAVNRNTGILEATFTGRGKWSTIKVIANPLTRIIHQEYDSDIPAIKDGSIWNGNVLLEYALKALLINQDDPIITQIFKDLFQNKNNWQFTFERKEE